MHRAVLAGRVAVLAVLAVLADVAAAQQRVTLTNHESPWGKIPFDAGGATSVVISADGKHGAYVIPAEKGFRVVVDGQAGLDEYERVARDSFVFSGGRFAYAARTNNRWFVFENQRPGDPYDEVAGSSVCFSPTAPGAIAHLAYVAVRDGKTFVVLDGRAEPPCDSVDDDRLVFNALGNRLACVVRRSGRASLVLDGKDGTPFDEISRPLFSGDGAHVACAARNGVRWFVLLDGQPQPAQGAIVPGTLAMSFDGVRLAYAIRFGNGMRVADGPNLGDVYDWVFDDSLTFSPDGKRLAYAVRRGRGCAAVIDGKPDESSFEGIVPGSITFSRDGRHVAYVAEMAREGRVERHVVADGRVGPPFEWIRGTPRFSPTGLHVAYVAQRADGRQCVVVDGTPGKPYVCLRGEPVFNDNGSGIAVLAVVEDDRFDAGDELPPELAHGGAARVVFDRSADFKWSLHSPRALRRADEQQAAREQRPLEIRLAVEQISYD
jgi:hypothetical protein